MPGNTPKPDAHSGSSSFATFLIIGPTCFFLGIIFSQFPYDFPLLWTSEPVAAAFLDQLEVHLKFVHQSPPLIARILHIAIGTGFLGFFVKLFKPSESNMLFDGASSSSTSSAAGIWNEEGFAQTVDGPLTGEVILGREDSLKVMAASNTILALVLVGILVLQAGQWYAERKDREERDGLDKADALQQQQQQQQKVSGSQSKKKQ
ncbi:sedoheptulose 1-7-bisphosphatase [Apiospora arundinis]